MKNDIEIFGCYISITQALPSADQKMKDKVTYEGKLFRGYIWSEKGIDGILKRLKNEDYGQDLKLILFQFYVNPIPILLQNLKEIEPYRKNEKSIGIPIIVTDENFFNKSEEERYNFLKHSIFQKLDLLSEVVRKKKLDTKMEQLKTDLRKILN